MSSSDPVAAVLPSGAKITREDWQLAKDTGAYYGVDPYILVAIGLHETAWGSLGQGKGGNILGVGAYDKNPTYAYSGLAMQLDRGGEILHKNKVHTIADIQRGALHVGDKGQVRWASADKGPSYPWSTDVVRLATTLEGMGAFEDGSGLSATSSAIDNPQQRQVIEKALHDDAKNGKNRDSSTGGFFGGINSEIGSVVSAPLHGIEAVGGFFAWFGKGNNILRLIGVLGGAVLIIIALVSLFRGAAVTAVAGGVASKLGGTVPQWGK